jgi:hypothetical protein
VFLPWILEEKSGTTSFTNIRGFARTVSLRSALRRAKIYRASASIAKNLRKRKRPRRVKVKIDAESQSEFELKRGDLLNKIAGDRYEFDLEKSYKPRGSTMKAQNEMVEHWNKRFAATIAKIKKEINEVI